MALRNFACFFANATTSVSHLAKFSTRTCLIRVAKLWQTRNLPCTFCEVTTQTCGVNRMQTLALLQQYRNWDMPHALPIYVLPLPACDSKYKMLTVHKISINLALCNGSDSMNWVRNSGRLCECGLRVVNIFANALAWWELDIDTLVGYTLFLSVFLPSANEARALSCLKYFKTYLFMVYLLNGLYYFAFQTFWKRFPIKAYFAYTIYKPSRLDS